MDMELLIWLGLGLTISFASWAILALKKRRAESWPMVAGRFEQGHLRGGDKGYIADLSYSYSANGAYFAGFYQRSFLMERQADEFVDGLKGQQVFVRHHPEHPENSVVREQDNVGLLFLN